MQNHAWGYLRLDLADIAEYVLGKLDEKWIYKGPDMGSTWTKN